jgi:protein-arginine kinase activator protein McsA
MLCDMCKQGEATIHTTHIVVGDTQRHLNLCGKCFETSKPADARDLTTALQSGCRYCGGEPHIGGADPIVGIRGIRKSSSMCKPCAEEYYRFMRQAWPGFGDPSISDEQIANINASDGPAIFTEAEEHMRKWVADKKS